MPPNGFADIAAGGEWSLALMMDGSLAAWGYDGKLQVTNLPAGNDYVAISAGYDYGVALKLDGSLVAWGDDTSGQVFNMPAGKDFVSIDCAWDWALAKKTDGSLVAWGLNTSNQCSVPSGTTFGDIEAGAYHGLALTTVPEPATATLLLAGGWMLIRRRKR